MMDAAEAKRRKIQYFKGEETANPALIAAGWKLDPDEDSQVLIPPSPCSEEPEEPENQREEEAAVKEKPGTGEPENN